MPVTISANCEYELVTQFLAPIITTRLGLTSFAKWDGQVLKWKKIPSLRNFHSVKIEQTRRVITYPIVMDWQPGAMGWLGAGNGSNILTQKTDSK